MPRADAGLAAVLGFVCVSTGFGIQYSPSAKRYVFYPRTLAPGTLADDLEWREIYGAGRFTPTPSRDDRPGRHWPMTLPQLLAVVEWDVGPRFSTELIDVEPENIKIGMRVTPGVL